MASFAERIRAIAEREELSPRFPAAVEAEVRRWRAAPGIDDPELQDWSALPFVTIDGPETRDLDQAALVEALPRGFRLRYAIADASFYAAAGSALFAEALARGASYYLPGLSIPMLPRELSEGLVSLGPNVARRALVFDVELDRHGGVSDFRLVRARIASQAKLSFDEVEELCQSPAQSPLARKPFAPSLRAIRELGALRAAHEDRKEMVRYRRVETGVGLDGEGRLVFRRETRRSVELANEQLSILCNALGARYLESSNPEHVQPVYRIHAPPDPERVASFERLVRAVARDRGLPDDPWVYRRAASAGLAGYLESLPTEGAPGRLARALHRQAMVLNGRSVFSIDAAGHFGVGEAVYSRFTAPMREVVGVFCHKEALERLTGRRARSRTEDEQLREQVIEAANRAKDTQRRLDRDIDLLALDALFGPELRLPEASRPIRRATVMGFSSSRIYLLLDEPEIDVRVMLRDLGRELGGAWLEMQGDGARLVARDSGKSVCRFGDTVSVRAHGPDGAMMLVESASR
jgi:ribonuclease R